MPNCKYCGSPNVVKYGTFEGVQRYFCKDCRRKSADNDALFKMKTPARVVGSALSCYFRGMPLDGIQGHLQQQFGLYFSEAGIYNWVIRFSREAAHRAKTFTPIVGDRWVADETVLKVGGRNLWFFDIIDERSRFLLASHLAESRTIKDVATVMRKALQRTGKAPKVIITDRLSAYPDGIEQVFGADTKHIPSKPFVDVDSTNLIERFHGTLKERTDVIRGFKNIDTARLLTDAWLVHYNFFKEHETLGNVPPAQKMPLPAPFKDWLEVVTETPESRLVLHAQYLTTAHERAQARRRKRAREQARKPSRRASPPKLSGMR